MKEFVFGTAAQFDWLEALLADGRCHVFELYAGHGAAGL